MTDLFISPAEVEELKAQMRMVPPSEPRDWLAEGRAYLARERWTNAPPEMVVCLMERIAELEADCDVRDEFISWLVAGDTEKGG